MKILIKIASIILLISLLFSCAEKKLIAENEDSIKNFDDRNLSDDQFLDNVIEKTKQVLSTEWFIVKNDNGFSVYYCKSCNEKFLAKKDSFRELMYFKNSKNTSNKQMIKDSFAFKIDSFMPNNKSNFSSLFFESAFLKRDDFFQTNGPDSVCYYSTVSLEYTEYKSEQEYRNSHPNNGVIKFDIHFETKWSDEKYQLILRKNNRIKEQYSEAQLTSMKTNSIIFSDFRFWIPKGKLGKGIERLPYRSEWCNKSIFIIQDKPYLSARIFNENDSEINEKRDRALRIIALTLGIKDFHSMN